MTSCTVSGIWLLCVQCPVSGFVRAFWQHFGFYVRCPVSGMRRPDQGITFRPPIMFGVRCPVSGMRCPELSTAFITIIRLSVQCPVSGMRCPVSGISMLRSMFPRISGLVLPVRCPVSGMRCPVSGFTMLFGLMTNVRCPDVQGWVFSKFLLEENLHSTSGHFDIMSGVRSLEWDVRCPDSPCSMSLWPMSGVRVSSAGFFLSFYLKKICTAPPVILT